MISVCPSCNAKNRLPAGRLNQRARCSNCKTELSPPARPIEITEASDFDELLQHCPLPVLVDFWAPWCGPCRMVAPELVKIAAQRQGQLVVAKLNTDTFPAIAGRYRIEGIPALLVFSDGKERQRMSGAQTASAILRTLGV